MSNRDPFASETPLESAPGREYDERTFLYFLAVERARADRSNRPVRVLLATLEPRPGTPIPISRATADRLFRSLRTSLRETDVTGWYTQHRVAGAVISLPADRQESDVASVIERRVDTGMRQQLPSRIARSLHVRVFAVPPEWLRNA